MVSTVRQAPFAKKILVVRYRFLGDTILTVPFLRNLRYAYPDAVIDVLAGPNSMEVLEGCPYINELIEFDTTRFHKYDSGNGAKKSFWHYVKLLRTRKYEMVFVLKRSWSSALLAFLTGAKFRVGYAAEGRRILLTTPVRFDPHKHEVESLLDVLRAVGVPIIDRHVEAWVSEHERNELLSLVPALRSSEKRVLLHAAAAHPDKMYPLQSWAMIAAQLSEQGFLPFFTGAAQDFELYDRLQQMAGISAVNLAGQLSIRQSVVLYSFMKLAVCVDSGPAHMSAAAGVPTVAIFGPTDPERWRPYGAAHRTVYDTGLSCRPCHYKKSCSNRECLTELSPALVLGACMETLQLASQREPITLTE